MDGYVVHGNVDMTRGSLLRVEDGQEMMVYVRKGEVWLTQAGERIDRCLLAGASFQLDRQGVALIQALEPSVLALTALDPVLYARRITLNVAGTRTARVVYDAARERLPFGARLWHGVRRRWIDAFQPRARATSAAL